MEGVFQGGNLRAKLGSDGRPEGLAEGPEDGADDALRFARDESALEGICRGPSWRAVMTFFVASLRKELFIDPSGRDGVPTRRKTMSVDATPSGRIAGDVYKLRLEEWRFAIHDACCTVRVHVDADDVVAL